MKESNPVAASAAPTGKTVPTKSALPSKSALPPKHRAIASRPYAHGGPVSLDQSAAQSISTGSASVVTGKQYPTYSAAAAASVPLASALFTSSDHHGHLLRRATFGARPSDVSDLKRLGVNGWLKRQLDPASIPDPSGNAAWRAFPLAGASPATIMRKTKKYSWDAMFATGQATLGRQIFSRRQLYEVVVDIFSAHLHVAVPSEQWATAPGYITNVIRKHAFGSFSGMLLAAMKHPAMLEFLSNDQSRKEHVNENLGRELLELHTVGIAGGYTENDVKASAAILSGRMINYDRGSYLYDSTEHVTGPVTVLGFTSANATGAGGEAVGDAYLRYLAMHPSTARTIARKIATRFVSDLPSDDLIDRLAQVYLTHGSSILAVVKAVFLSSDFWGAVGVRMRRPLEDAVGAARVLNVGLGSSSKNTSKGVVSLYWDLWNAGQPPLGWNPPNGYPDVAAAWLGAGSMIQRWNTHRALVHGWWGGLKYTKALSLVPSGKSVTAEKWVKALCVRLVGNAPTPDHLAALLAAGGLTPSSRVPYDYLAGEIASLVLDSAYFQLR
ncbi:MAG: hypothetical protein JWQ39_3038 [Glaciihabitans sp.]|jgi:uncharacterized protein (DUF1800 family)|nr:hypothetical protein [Glaciihabitans sp.]